MNRRLERVLEVANVGDCGVMTVSHLAAGKKYREVAEILLNTLSGEKWQDIAEAHRLAVAWESATAHEWLNLVVDFLCTQPAPPTLHRGTIIGMLEACNWLDKGPWLTSFQNNVLGKLAALICLGKIFAFPERPDQGDQAKQFDDRLLPALRSCLFPRKYEQIIAPEIDRPYRPREEISEADLRRKRGAAIRETLVYFGHNLPEPDKISPWGKNFLDRLAHSLLERLPPAQKLTAVRSIY